MEIKKDIGNWLDDKYDPTINVTMLDDIAYYIYCQYRKNRIKENITSQSTMIHNPKVYWKFYNDAKILIRKEKIDKIRNGSK